MNMNMKGLCHVWTVFGLWLGDVEVAQKGWGEESRKMPEEYFSDFLNLQFWTVCEKCTEIQYYN